MSTADLGAFLRFCGFSKRSYQGRNHPLAKEVKAQLAGFGLAESAPSGLSTCSPSRPKRSARALLTGWHDGDAWKWRSIAGFSPVAICRYEDATIAVYSRAPGAVPQPRLCLFWKDGVDLETFEFIRPERPHRGESFGGARVFAKRLDQVPGPEPWPGSGEALVARPLYGPASLLTGEYRVMLCQRDQLLAGDVLLARSSGSRPGEFEARAARTYEADLQPFLLAGLLTAELESGVPLAVEYWYERYLESHGAALPESERSEAALLHWVGSLVHHRCAQGHAEQYGNLSVDEPGSSEGEDEDDATAASIRREAGLHLYSARAGVRLHSKINELPAPMAEWCELSRIAYIQNDRQRCIDALSRMAEVACHLLLDRHECDVRRLIDVLGQGQELERAGAQAPRRRLTFGDKVDLLRDLTREPDSDDEDGSDVLGSLTAMMQLRNALFHRYQPPDQEHLDQALGHALDLVVGLSRQGLGVIPALPAAGARGGIQEALIEMGLMPFPHPIRIPRPDAAGAGCHWLRPADLSEQATEPYPQVGHSTDALLWLKRDETSTRLRCTAPVPAPPTCISVPSPAPEEDRSARPARLRVLDEVFAFEDIGGFEALLEACRCHNWALEAIRAALASVVGQEPADFVPNPAAHLDALLTEAPAQCRELVVRLRAGLEQMHEFRRIRNRFQHELNYRRLERLIAWADGALGLLQSFHRSIGLDTWTVKTSGGRPELATPQGNLPLERPWLVKDGPLFWIVDPRRPECFFRRTGERISARELCNRLRRGPMEYLLRDEVRRIEQSQRGGASGPVVEYIRSEIRTR